jgi:hypothetical protein
MSPNAWGRKSCGGLSQWVRLDTGAQKNFGDLTPYLTYDLDQFPFSQKGVVAHMFLNLDPICPLQRLLRFALKLHSIFRCCESKSDRIGIILKPNPIQPNVKPTIIYSHSKFLFKGTQAWNFSFDFFCKNRNYMVLRACNARFLKIVFDLAEIFDF